MRFTYPLLWVSAALFVSGVGLVVLSARGARVPPAPAADVLAPVASVRQIMRGIVDPAATVVFGAVSSTMTAAGLEEKAPKTPEEWERVANSAAALAEAGNLLMVGSRAIDHKEWAEFSRQLSAAGAEALRAAEAKDADGVFGSGEGIYASCDGCHRKYERTE